jgi:nicotinamide mononucleotide (NMN) deamidase PncC
VRALLAGLTTTARIAVSGIAGPDGGTAEKPVGTVVIGVRYHQEEEIVTRRFTGTRDHIRQAAAADVLARLQALIIQ